jgi:hypothetical protein
MNGEFEGIASQTTIDETGGNRDNRVIASVHCSVFSVYFVSSLGEGATMHPLFAQASG